MATKPHKPDAEIGPTLKPATPEVKKPSAFTKVHIAAKDRDYLTTNLALLLKADVPVGQALQSLSDTSSSKPLKKVMAVMRADIDEGMPLWKALERSGTASRQTLSLVRLGEESGKLVDNLQVAARQEEKQRRFKARVRSALLYPTFVLGLTLVVGLLVAWFLLPRLSVTFSQLNVKLPPISKLFIGIGTILRKDGLFIIPGIFGLIATSFFFLFIYPKTRKVGNFLLFHMPVVSSLMYQVEIARFGYLLGTLLQAGLSVTQALELMEQATTAVRYQNLYKYLRTAFDEGYSFSTSIPRYPKGSLLLPGAVQQMIIAGEHSGSLPESLLQIAAIYEEKSEVSTQNLETALEPILLVVVWLGVLGVAVAVILPIYSLVGNLET